MLWPNFGHCTTTIVWERMVEKHLAQLVGEGACQPDIFTKYRLECELSYGSCPISVCLIQGVVCILYYLYFILRDKMAVPKTPRVRFWARIRAQRLWRTFYLIQYESLDMELRKRFVKPGMANCPCATSSQCWFIHLHVLVLL